MCCRLRTTEIVEKRMFLMPVITAIEPQKNSNRYNIYIDGQFASGIQEEILLEFDLKVGRELNDGTLDAIITKDLHHKALNYAILLLSYRGRSSKEIADKMKEKGYAADIIDTTLQKLGQLGYVNDVEFAKILIRDKQRLKKAGKNLIRVELWQKGIASDLIDQLVNQSISEEDEFERAKTLFLKKVNTYSRDDQKAKKRKGYGFLIRKGYSSEIASRVIRECFTEEYDGD